MKVTTIIGARPQFIKAAPVSAALCRAGIREVVVHTGQHFDPLMSDVFFQELDLRRPDHALGINGGGHGSMTGRMLIRIEEVLNEEKPSAVVVYGDTNSTLAGALAAAKLGIPVAHVEAGLRSGDRNMPEEINRVAVDHMSELLLCPTSAAMANLRKENCLGDARLVGDVMFDSMLALLPKARASLDVEALFGVTRSKFVLATLHRAENTATKDGLQSAVDFLRSSAGMPVVLPLHPRTRLAADKFNVALDGLRIIPPVGYLEILALLDACAAVFTDSGGLQKEAYFAKRPCVTLRSSTEWVETIENGWNRLWTVSEYAPRRPISEYGDGSASDRIAQAIAEVIRLGG